MAARAWTHKTRRGTSRRRDRHRDAGDLHLHRAEVVAAGDVERPPVVTAEREGGGGGRSVHDTAELLAGRVHDPNAASTAAIDVALDIDLHAVGHARLW